MTFAIVQEDATRYLPHDPTGREYEHYVYSDQMDRNPLTGQLQRRLAYSGTKAECEAFVARLQARAAL